MLLEALRADARLAEWLRDLENEGDPRVEAALPGEDELPDVLLDLSVPHEDINELVALRARLGKDAEAMTLLARCVARFVRDMGEIGKGWEPPPFPASTGPLGRFFHVFVFLAALPYVRAHHRKRGVPEVVSWRTLADLGRQVAVHRRRRGTGGLLFPWWLALHFHGEIFQLGRLQFQRARLGQRTGRAVAAAGWALGPGDPCLSLHIPDFRGPLSPSACERSLALAREFFARHYADEHYEIAVCHSWLLDPQLRRYLPADSNIIRFQDRFELAYVETTPDDGVPVGFVFGDPELPAEGLPRHTGVERAVGDHLRAGGHWYGGHGWLVL
ncbi:acyltransferase domain-containing protein [Streptomyces yaanensis]|uniref:Acyltransferase domain-containing protein n=1 Tax=Streptomyces yaanensis TaxID=1142239 RepID=A0ABV7SK20_9ACTN|nr:acyltransferase domain-containing protein [Streptomyces sp. CGMCC 4.7035]WNC03232.1 acyltransferase domain-containing protein [Streptomyces sp. CGMCC 4.7035]